MGKSNCSTPPLCIITSPLPSPSSTNSIDFPMRSETRSTPPFSRLLLFLLPLLLLLPPSAAQPDLSDGVRCLADSVYPCQAYAFYRASLAVPLSADLASVGDLFGTSRALIARATNLTVAQSVLPLRQDQPLLVPISCGCDRNRNRSYYPAAYQILSGDTYYLVSTREYANLTAYPAVELVNPTLVPTDLDIGVIVTFPIFCQCLSNNTIAGRRVLGLVSYVLQPSDTYASVASSFGIDAETLTTINGPFNGTYSVVFVPLLQIPPPLIRTSVVSEAPASPPTAPTSVVERNENTGVIAGLAAALAVVGVLCALLLLLLAWCRRRWNRKEEAVGKNGRQTSLERSGKGGGEGRFGSLSSADDKLIADISEWLDKYKVFDVATLRQATAGFDRSYLIQGSVYKGTIDGELVAVKKMKWNAYDELKILQKVNHSNLVKLEGFCIDGKEGTTYLVYEYVENGSLDTWLHSPAGAGGSDGRRLDWRSRLRIALDVANGLQYIHEHTWPRVVHKDIKSSNVLLDASFHAKIANFGLARTGLNAVTTHIVGTQGYVAPEYLADGIVSIKMDVFAFGVVLLELVTGRPAFDERTGEALWSEAERLLFRPVTLNKVETEALLLEWMDAPLVQQSCPVESVMSVIQVARACLHRDPAKRPSMVEATYLLSKADEHFADYSGDGLTVVSGSDVAAR